jgi:tetratricopeptide (TPR) repeat protein
VPSHRIRLTPLDEEPSRALAAIVLGRRAEPDEGLVAAIATEAEGSPFFIAELARHAARSRDDPPSAGSREGGRLARVIHDRLERLRPAERGLLEIVATAAGPLDRSLALAAAGLGERGRPDVVRLGQGCLLRTAQVGDRLTVETYHDRIREALLLALPAERRRRCHRDLATALRVLPEPDPEALFHHYRGAGEDQEAALFVVPAADRAAAALAFDRAAELYQHALDLGAPDRTRLLESLAECLVNAGRGSDAPPCFLAAAEGRAGDPAAGLALRRQAAEQLIRTGRVDEGTAIFRRVLADVGVEMPTSAREASLLVAARMLRLLVRGLKHEVRPARTVPPAVLGRLDAVWGACGGLGIMDPPLASALAVQHLLEALDAGEPMRIAYGLFYQCVLEAAIGGSILHRRAERMLAMGQRLSAGVGDPALRGFGAAARGSMAWHMGRFEEASRACDEAAAIFENECRGAAWHRVATENYGLSALAFRGDMRALAARRRAALERAEKHGDRFGAAIFRIGQLSLDTLAEDQPERAITDADSITASWPLRLYHQTIITVQAELYRGAPGAAHARIERAWPSLEKDGLLRLEFPRLQLLHLRAMAALGTAARRGREARGLVCSAVRGAKQIAASELPPAAPFRASIRAGIARIEGDHRRAVVASLAAGNGFEAAGMALYAAAHRMALGPVGARERMVTLGVERPERMARMLCP